MKNIKLAKEILQMAKSHLAGSILTNMETGKDYIEWYGLQELFDPDHVLSVEEKIKVYKSISPDEIRKITSKYIKKENVFIATVGNANEKELEKALSLI